jgi:hypothetical protein
VGSFSLFAEFRIDTGLGLLFLQRPEKTRDEKVLLDGIFFPLPEAGFYGQFNFGNFHLGTGMRGFSYIAYTNFWPTLYGEYDLARFTIHAEIGGGMFGIIDLLQEDSYSMSGTQYSESSGMETSDAPYFMVKLNPTIIPEISVWFRFGKFFKVGVGWITMFLLNPAESKIININPQFYLGYKMTFPSAAARKKPDGTQRIF